jgi:hypothetical protein
MKNHDTSVLRHVIRQILSENPSRSIGDSGYRAGLRDVLDKLAQNSGGIFKISGNKDRLTLANRESRPFRGMSEEEIGQKLLDIINKAGLRYMNTLIPGEGLSRSFDTYIVYDNDKKRNFSIVFGMSHSSAEVIQFVSLDREMKRLTQDKKNPIEIFNGSDYVLVDDVDSVGARGRKPDVVFTLMGDTKLTVSLKNLPTGSPTEMQQWGGLKRFATHSEVLRFVNDVKEYIGKNSGSYKRFYRRIEDENIKDQVVWGTSGDRVDVIVAGGIPVLSRVEDRPNAYRIDFKEGSGSGRITYYSKGDSLPAGFEPVLFARPASDRGFGGLTSYRVVAYPLRAAQSSGTLEIPESSTKTEVRLRRV